MQERAETQAVRPVPEEASQPQMPFSHVVTGNEVSAGWSHPLECAQCSANLTLK